MSRTDSNVHALENSELSIEFIPVEGGRISSFRSVRSGMEFLTQARRRGPCVKASLNTRFQEGYCAGIEECLPTVAVSGAETEGGPAPDHGDFWQVPWQVLSVSDSKASMFADGWSRPLRFTKTLTLNRNELRVDYEVVNTGSSLQSFLYACHPLFAIGAGDRIRLPEEIKELTLDYSKDNRHGSPGSKVAWPVTQNGVRLDVALGPEAGAAEMFYSPRLNETACGIYRNASREFLEVSFDRERLPYLGVWLCYAGWPGGDEEPQQYAVALEPSTSPGGSLARAQQTRTAIYLNPGDVYAWEIVFAVKAVPAPTAFR